MLSRVRHVGCVKWRYWVVGIGCPGIASRFVFGIDRAVVVVDVVGHVEVAVALQAVGIVVEVHASDLGGMAIDMKASLVVGLHRILEKDVAVDTAIRPSWCARCNWVYCILKSASSSNMNDSCIATYFKFIAQRKFPRLIV